MQSDTIYTKTSKGILETRNKTTRLPREVGLVFVAVDGKSTVAQLEAKSSIAPAKLRESLEKLAADGFIKDVGAGALDLRGGGAELDFTSVDAVASLNAEAAAHSLAEAAAQAAARDAARAALDARLKQEAESRARTLAEMREQSETGAKEQAEAAASAASREKIKAEEDLGAAPDPETRAEAEARLRMAADAVARAQAEMRVRAEAAERAHALAEEKRAAEVEAQQEANVRARAEREALAQAAAEAKARAALEEQIRTVQSGGKSSRFELPQVAVPQTPAPATPAPDLPVIDTSRSADEAEPAFRPPDRVEPLIDRPKGDRSLGAHGTQTPKGADVDFDRGAARQSGGGRKQAPEFAPGSDKPAAGLVRAMEAAAALVKQAEAEEKPEDDRDRPPVEDRVVVDRAAHDVIAEQAAARARARVEALDSVRIAERQRREQEAANRAEVFRRLRIRKTLIRVAITSGAVLIVGIAGFLQFVSLSVFIPGVERNIAVRLKQPVSIGRLRYPMFPTPRVVLENVVIANGRVKIDEVQVPGLQFGASVHDRVEARGVTIDSGIFPALPAWSTTLNPAGVRLKNFRLEQVKIASLPVDVGTFDAEIEFAANGAVHTATLKNPQATLTLQPQQEQVRFTLSAQDWQLPFGPAVEWTFLDLSGSANSSRVVVNALHARLAGGTVDGTVTILLAKPIAAEGTLTAENVRLQEVMPAFTSAMPLGGLLKTNARYALKADSIERIFEMPQVEARFSIANGEFQMIDLVRTVQASRGAAFRGGRTPFDGFSGSLRTAGGRYSYRDLSLTSMALTASGNAEIGPNGELTGQVSSEVGSKGRVVARATVSLAGTINAPTLRQ